MLNSALPTLGRWSLYALLAAGTLGCQSFGQKAPWGDGPPPQSEPDLDKPADRWGFVGKEGRGNRPLRDENDPLKPFLMSPEAQQIERNLGYK